MENQKEKILEARVMYGSALIGERIRDLPEYGIHVQDSYHDKMKIKAGTVLKLKSEPRSDIKLNLQYLE